MSRQSPGNGARESGMQLLDRALAILGLFEPDRPEWTTTEAARAIGLPIPTAHRILAALHASGYLARDPFTKRFSLGPASLDLGRRAERVIDLDALARSLLERLSRFTGETALMTVLTEGRDGVVCSVRIESPQPLGLSVTPDRVLPLHAGAMQRALLAFLPEEHIKQVLKTPLDRLCRSTITDPKKLRLKIDEVRARGWAISFEETDPGVWGIAIPIIAADGSPIAALGLAARRGSLQADHVRQQLAALGEEADQLAQRMGYAIPELDLAPRRRATA
jgi:DNA-binding IclR family transcriptional regulator